MPSLPGGGTDISALLMGISTLTINPSIQKKVPYDAVKDFAPISQVVSLPNVLVAHPSLPARSVKELIALARAQPTQLTYASAGVGSNQYSSCWRWKARGPI